MYGTRAASKAWGDRVREVLTEAGCITIAAMAMLFWHPVAGYLVAVWGDDFAAIGSMKSLETLWGTLRESFDAKWIGTIGPGAGHVVKLLNRTLA